MHFPNPSLQGFSKYRGGSCAPQFMFRGSLKTCGGREISPSSLGEPDHSGEAQAFETREQFHRIFTASPTVRIMSKEQAAAQVQEEDDEPDEWCESEKC